VRVLFTTWAWRSHLFPMVPLAWACRAAGHDVRVATQPALVDEVTRAGLTAVAVGRDVDVVGLVRGYVSRPGSHPATAVRRTGPPRVLGMLLALVEAMVDDLVAVVRAWGPDVVVHEGTTLAGPLAAAAAGRPAVRHLYGLDLLSPVRTALIDLLAPTSERLGLDPVDPLGNPTVDPCPPGLQLPADGRRVPVRYVPYNGAGCAPSPLPEPARRPRICVTWGTTMARLGADLFLARPVADALCSPDVEVVAAVTGNQRPLLAGLRAQVRVAESVPLHLLLPSCDLVVHHGGAGTLLTALSCGLPQLVVPQLPDHTVHGRRLADCDAGLLLPRDEAMPDALRAAADRLLTPPEPREAARRLGAEMGRRPPPAAVVGVLEGLAAG
jgi:UDP:flavonoid glycosyltransferase YjiC (YdhE family)